ncbi:PREDICTED: E3 ubiquitin-protein ligase MARCH5 [Rhagoletis zephyria]|uniref:E3 ubiquitin-protein ligase MARCH5 n=1 Tax=Rhagoletis zephyria TaxID=28612 RepID=UPI0008115A85|nr:PREDICTED: E3 ubiquitin-protein ligase MARCH5 [Rhagoletis zephyria]XP_017477489.1 PREDICTED: E3 ubiquitin-protein ligase MARCH5 [Rhagoletis zephyria]XP_017477490.1 PREDICTED: E3 ubiquitin-protein ligase MARCH5 [Rhagoletis zephyria]XP_017477491.1 PREDICTED: E3 ubiquitin-protein ligase MARCH5 [Rhagoletis zephyria]
MNKSDLNQTTSDVTVDSAGANEVSSSTAGLSQIVRNSSATSLTQLTTLAQTSEKSEMKNEQKQSTPVEAHALSVGVGLDAITGDAAGNEVGERSCWICFATDEDNRLAPWVQPCKCRGTTKWVHQSCLYRWVDEKQKGNAMRAVSCQQCQTEYIIVFPHMGKVANILEAFDNLIKRLSPFLAAGIFVGSLYWTAVTYGAVTFLQIVGHKKGLALMENGDPLILLIGLPAIPVGLVLGRMIRWEDAVIRLIRNRRSVARKFPLMNFIIPYPEEEEEQSAQNPATPTLSDPVSATRIFCGALILPTISTIVGRLLFESIENTLHRTLLGGLTFIAVKGILKIYLKQQQYTRKKKRRIVDYTDENVRIYVNRSTSRHHGAGSGAGGAGPGASGGTGGAAASSAGTSTDSQRDANLIPQPLNDRISMV